MPKPNQQAPDSNDFTWAESLGNAGTCLRFSQTALVQMFQPQSFGAGACGAYRGKKTWIPRGAPSATRLKVEQGREAQRLPFEAARRYRRGQHLDADVGGSDDSKNGLRPVIE